MFSLRRDFRRALEKRWRKEKKRLLPPCSSVFRYLSYFHDDVQEKLQFRSGKKASIPDPNEYLQGYMFWFEYSKLQKTATLDIDATLVPATKKASFYCYIGISGISALERMVA